MYIGKTYQRNYIFLFVVFFTTLLNAQKSSKTEVAAVKANIPKTEIKVKQDTIKKVAADTVKAVKNNALKTTNKVKPDTIKKAAADTVKVVKNNASKTENKVKQDTLKKIKTDSTKTVKVTATKAEVKNAKTINGMKDDFSPMVYEKGLVFCSNSRKVKKGQDEDKVPEDLNLKFAVIDSLGNLMKAISFGNRTNSKTHEGPSCFSAKGDTMYLTRNMSKGGKDKKNAEGKYTLKIYVKYRDSTGNFIGDKFLPFEMENYNYCHPTISNDGTRLYFSSNMPGGFGGMDLYVVRRVNDTTWSKPINLGPRINTSKNEVFPYINTEGVLYFSSNGHHKVKDREDLDIFGIEINNKRAILQPLVAPINSEKDDFGITFLPKNTKKGYFSSNREGGIGGDDVYTLEFKD
jgi:WD40-like Beta Propeller Repeat